MCNRNLIILPLIIISLTACSRKAPIYGLAPFYPESRITDTKILYAEVDSLHPKLKWETFPRPADTELYRDELFDNIKNVQYDIKIWLSENESPKKLLYFEKGLSEPQFQVPEPLMDCARYFWTVRARFEVGGKTRVTDWSALMIMDTINDAIINPRSPIIPQPYLHRFRTSCKAKS